MVSCRGVVLVLSAWEGKVSREESPEELLVRKTGDFLLQYCIYAVAKLGFADLLGNGPKGYEELARSVDADPRGVLRLLQRLSMEGVFSEVKTGCFGLTPSASLLRSGAWRERVIVWFEEWLPVEQQLLYTVKTGKPAFEYVHGTGFYEYAAKHPAFDADFQARMSELTSKVSKALVESYDFTGSKLVVDIGGGEGVLISSVLKANPHLHGILFDRPSAIRGAKGFLEAEGVAGRCKLVGGDFFRAVPDRGDLYILKWVLDDWRDNEAFQILKNIRRSMNPQQGRVLVIEQLMPQDNQPSPAKSLDLLMMVQGRTGVRTEAEIREILGKTAFETKRVIATQSTFSIIEALPVSPRGTET